MTAFIRGTTKSFTVQFFQYDGGPLEDVTNIHLKVVSVDDGTTIIDTGTILHIGLGTYSYAYDVPVNLPLGDYIATWTSTEANAAETVTVVEALAGMGTGPCGTWPVTWTCELTAADAAVTGTALQAASEVLWSLSGQRFGLCSTVLRPCRRGCRDTLWPAGSTLWPNVWPGQTYPMPFWWQGQWLNLTCATCTTGCSCNVVSEFVLPGDVHDIVSIIIDGVELSPSAYRLDNNRIVVRTDGGEWPICNDLSKNDTEVGTWSVTARYGEDLPELGKMAVGELACEFVKVLTDEECTIA